MPAAGGRDALLAAEPGVREVIRRTTFKSRRESGKRTAQTLCDTSLGESLIKACGARIRDLLRHGIQMQRALLKL